MIEITEEQSNDFEELKRAITIGVHRVRDFDGRMYYVECTESVIDFYKDPELEVYHRVSGPASITDLVGTILYTWYRNDKRHRLDGPAMIWHQNTYWYVNDVLITQLGKSYGYIGPQELRDTLDGKI
jgi:hypothetical protein